MNTAYISYGVELIFLHKKIVSYLLTELKIYEKELTSFTQRSSEEEELIAEVMQFYTEYCDRVNLLRQKMQLEEPIEDKIKTDKTLVHYELGTLCIHLANTGTYFAATIKSLFQQRTLLQKCFCLMAETYEFTSELESTLQTYKEVKEQTCQQICQVNLALTALSQCFLFN